MKTPTETSAARCSSKQSTRPWYRDAVARTMAVVVLLVLVSFVLVGCGKKGKEGGRVPTKTREQLISQLRDKGDANTSMVKRQTAYSAYRFAAYYAPQDKEIQSKFEEVKKMPVGMVANVQEIHALITGLPRPEDFRDFPKATPDMDLVNLEMLNDERLTGDLGYTVYQVSTTTLFATFPPSDAGDPNGDQVCVFTSTPRYSLSEVRQTYGPPTSTATEGIRTSFTYGRFRIIADNTARVRLVIFPLFPE